MVIDLRNWIRMHSFGPRNYRVVKNSHELRGWTLYLSSKGDQYWNDVDRYEEYKEDSKEAPLVKYFVAHKLETIDNRQISGIFWAIADYSQYNLYGDEIQVIADQCKVKCIYERRGSIATNGRAAYRIMAKKKKQPLSAKYEIVDILGCISEDSISEKLKKSFMVVSWHGHSPTYEIRKWNNETETLGKGISLNEDELRRLKKLIDDEIDYLDSDKKKENGKDSEYI